MHFIFFIATSLPPRPCKGQKNLKNEIQVVTRRTAAASGQAADAASPLFPAISVMDFIRQAQASCHPKNSSCYRKSCCLSSGMSGTTSNSSNITAVFFLSSVKWISQCCGSGMFIPDPGSELSPSRIPDPRQRI